MANSKEILFRDLETETQKSEISRQRHRNSRNNMRRVEEEKYIDREKKKRK